MLYKQGCFNSVAIEHSREMELPSIEKVILNKRDLILLNGNVNATKE